MGLKHVLKGIVIGSIILVMLFSNIYASPRVVCEVKVLSEHSAQIILKWNGDYGENIRITGWKLVDDQSLKVTYITGKDVELGWNTRKIEGAGYSFPMKVILEQQGEEAEAIFSDLPFHEESKLSILNLYYRDIINGYQDGSFKPSNLVSRAEFAKMVTKAADYTLDENTISSFKDVGNSHWALNYIMTLANKGILLGKPGGVFDPNGQISLGAVLAVIDRTFTFYNEYGEYSGTLNTHWSNEHFLSLVNAGIIKETDSYYQNYQPDQKATREQCAILLSRVLEQLHQK